MFDFGWIVPMIVAGVLLSIAVGTKLWPVRIFFGVIGIGAAVYAAVNAFRFPTFWILVILIIGTVILVKYFQRRKKRKKENEERERGGVHNHFYINTNGSGRPNP